MFRSRKPTPREPEVTEDMLVLVDRAVHPLVVLLHDPSGFRAEQVRSLRNKLIAMNPDGASKSLVVTSAIRGEACDVLYGTREDLTWKLWIGKGDSLPRRFVVTVTELEGSDHLVLDFKSWDLAAQHAPGSLKFVPAKGAEKSKDK